MCAHNSKNGQFTKCIHYKNQLNQFNWLYGSSGCPVHWVQDGHAAPGVHNLSPRAKAVCRENMQSGKYYHEDEVLNLKVLTQY